MTSLISLRSAGVSLLIEVPAVGLPRVLHWGADVGPVTGADLADLARADVLAIASNVLDEPLRVAIVPEARFGWLGTPGLIGSRGGRGWSPDWRVREITLDGGQVGGFTDAGTGLITFRAVADDAALEMRLDVEMLPTGLVRARGEVTNLDASNYRVDEFTLRMPVPSQVREVLDFAGRWANERAPQRSTLGVGAHRREGRRGRTGADAAYILNLGEAGFSYGHGDLWATHVAWSGNHIHIAERDSSGVQVIGGGELLLPGEGELASGESYATPWVYFNHADGLDAQAARFHAHLRALPVHPDASRPVTLNVWEAVYFNHDAARLIDLAERAAALGVERYVLDDGWFGARRNDHAGLGDWVVSADAWPDGLHPLVNRVQELGMQFGLWFEPEMVNMDSDVARAHPEWVMQPGGRLPVESRFQQVLNLSIPGAFDHVLGQMSEVLATYAIDYVKWDHNRDLVDSGTAPEGAPAVSAQTSAFYRLLDELRARFPHVEFESCSSGGARVDLGVLERAERVWVSDNIDPEERQRMLWWTGQLLPLELMGSHVASGRSHVTARWHDLNFRAATAVFGHLGIEWDLAEATAEELQQLGWWIDWYKTNRQTLLTGRLVRCGFADPEVYFKGVVTRDKAIFSLSMLQPTSAISLGRLCFPGLDDDARYRVRTIDFQLIPPALRTPWQLDPEGVIATGRQLATVGLRAPLLQPSTAVLFELERV